MTYAEIIILDNGGDGQRRIVNGRGEGRGELFCEKINCCVVERRLLTMTNLIRVEDVTTGRQRIFVLSYADDAKQMKEVIQVL